MKKLYKILTAAIYTTLMILVVNQGIKGSETHEQLFVEGKYITYNDGKNSKVMVPKEYQQKNQEFRGSWVTTVWNIDIAKHTSEAQYKAAYLEKLDQADAANFNAMLFQTRSMNETFYESEYAPFSKDLVASGVNPGWDVMRWIIDETHARGMELHFWMNPYRVSTTMKMTKDEMLSGLHNDNFAKLNPELVVRSGHTAADPDGTAWVLNPGEPEVQQYVRNVVKEAMDLYPDVDGFHFDDYFYFGNTDDDLTYKTHGAGLTLEDFRRASVDKLIKGIHDDIQVFNELNDTSVVFGIAPSGIYQNKSNKYPNGSPTNGQAHYDSHFIDTVKWIKEGWLDYITPQIYWEFTHTLAPYADLVTWWAEQVRGTDVKLIIGISLSNNQKPEFWEKKVLYNSQFAEIEGSIYYGNKDATALKKLDLVFENYWTTKVPTGFEKDLANDIEVSLDGTLKDNIYKSNVEVTLTSASSSNILYKLGEDEWTIYDSPFTVEYHGTKNLYYKTIDSTNYESKIKIEEITILKDNDYLPTFTIEGGSKDGKYYEGSTLTITADPAVTKIEYYIMNGLGSVAEFIEYTEPITLTRVNKHLLFMRTIYDNTPSEIVQVEFYVIEEQAEETPELPTETTLIVDGKKEGRFYLNQVDIAFDDVGENDSIFYKIQIDTKIPKEFTKYTSPFKLKTQGLITVHYYVENSIGEQTEIIKDMFEMKFEIEENASEVVRDGEAVLKEDGNPISLPETYKEKDEQIRAIWFSTVNNIDIPQMTSVKQYKELISASFDRMKSNNFNTIFFQVRPMNDALYYSDLAPHSRYSTGTEGKDPGMDILKYAIEEAHKRGMELHAWLNPYRVATGTDAKEAQLNRLSKDNFARLNPELVLADKNGALILNPGEPKVQKYLNDIITELVTKYDLDGIHFDDYFYSYAGTNDTEDQAAFIANNPKSLTLGDWRRENVNTIVESISNITRSYNKDNKTNIKFGISPFGIWRNKTTDPTGSYSNGMQSYDTQYADTKKWVENKWLDYIAPQLYWQFDNFNASGRAIAPFADLVDWWYELSEKNDTGLIIGQGLYRLNKSEAAAYTNENEIIEQLRYLSTFENLLGMSFFTYNSLSKQDKGMTKTLGYLKEVYWKNTVKFAWDTDVNYKAVISDTVSNNTTLIIVIIVAAVLAIGGTTGTVIYLNKRKNARQD